MKTTTSGLRSRDEQRKTWTGRPGARRCAYGGENFTLAQLQWRNHVSRRRRERDWLSSFKSQRGHLYIYRWRGAASLAGWVVWDYSHTSPPPRGAPDLGGPHLAHLGQPPSSCAPRGKFPPYGPSLPWEGPFKVGCLLNSENH